MDIVARKISVLIPVYNGESFLSECIESVLAQDFAHCEILISDDCSTDGTRAVMERYAAKDRRIRWWTNATNLGQAENLNLCLREARGEYIKFVFADDKLLQPFALRRMAAILDGDLSVTLVGSASHVIDAQSALLQVRAPFLQSVTLEGFAVILRCLADDCWWDNIICEPTVVMFRRAQAARGFDPRYIQIIDLEMWVHLLERGRFAYIAEPLSAFRVHPKQQSETNRRHGVNIEEHSRLLRGYLTKPWMRKKITPQFLSNWISQIKENRSGEAVGLVAEMTLQLSAVRYAAYRLRQKTTRLFNKLTR